MKYKPQCREFDAGIVTLQNRATKGDNWTVYELSAADSNGDCSILIGPPTDTLLHISLHCKQTTLVRRGCPSDRLCQAERKANFSSQSVWV